MNINANSRLALGEMVSFQKEAGGPVLRGEVVGLTLYVSKDYDLNNLNSFTYIVIPEEFLNMEVDEEVFIPQCHTVDCPRIIYDQSF